jgi:hypothetical protein
MGIRQNHLTRMNAQSEVADGTERGRAWFFEETVRLGGDAASHGRAAVFAPLAVGGMSLVADEVFGAGSEVGGDFDAEGRVRVAPT